MQSKYMLLSAAVSSIGRRGNNEDNLYMDGITLSSNDKNELISFTAESVDAVSAYAIFDGMGGESCGELASEQASLAFKKWIYKLNHRKFFLNPVDMLQKYFVAAQSVVKKISRVSKSTSGTTAAILIVFEGHVMAANIGDSRILRCRNGKVEQISCDHTMAELMIQSGHMTREVAEKSHGKHQLTRFIGQELSEDKDIEPYTSNVFTAVSNDFYVLCSDGVTDKVTPKNMAEIIERESSCEDIAYQLVNSAISLGSRDNCTAIVVHVV